ncbi:hypothetical protein D3093_33195 (plasmid) [Azospirillum argentinense]|uniref:Uncharacterized protein n=1 Tax=Azospirillum argentinense TaxID=2970906 RepID=A0A4D8PNL7_9PROT|nr:hypothetical protein D3093_33195 [Azospirillum argentinense]
MAIARVGGSPVPCVCFHWTVNDLAPAGSGRTLLMPAETLRMDADGVVSSFMPNEILFRDADGIRPACPFFKLHAEWREDGAVRRGPVTPALLERAGLTAADLRWTVTVGNHKASHFTLSPGDRIDASVELRGDETARTPLLGRSPGEAADPLVELDRPVPMGAVQLSRPTADAPEVRLRFFAPAGACYGPRDLSDRMADAAARGVIGEWDGFALPPDRLILNPQAGWVGFSPELTGQPPLGPGDQRVNPTALFALLEDVTPEGLAITRSLGLVDDVGDGVVRCEVEGLPPAIARIVVGPPDFAPDRRHPVSLADTLTDREDREAARTGDVPLDDLGAMMRDIFERAFETSDLMNKDAQNDRSHRTNAFIFNPASSPFTPEQVEAMLWPQPDPERTAAHRAAPLELSEAGRRKHRRQSAIETLEDRLRENPGLIDAWVRSPLDPNPFFDRRMPALMRGSDGRPFHLTRRQWELLHRWARALRTAAPPQT